MPYTQADVAHEVFKWLDSHIEVAEKLTSKETALLVDAIQGLMNLGCNAYRVQGLKATVHGILHLKFINPEPLGPGL